MRQLVELHGGQIEARGNGPDTGTEFIVRLPLAAAAPALLAPVRNRGSEPVCFCGPLRILVVDDNADSADSLALLLRAEGHDVQVAYDGAGALKISSSFNPQVTLQDIAMPGMNGLEVARKLRETTATRDSILVALTGYGNSEDEEESYAAGFDHHLVKPVNFEALYQLLRSISRSQVRPPNINQRDPSVRTILRLPSVSPLTDKPEQVH